MYHGRAEPLMPGNDGEDDRQNDREDGAEVDREDYSKQLRVTRIIKRSLEVSMHCFLETEGCLQRFSFYCVVADIG